MIEQTFGVLKARFSILMKMVSHSFSVQRSIVIACATPHNYIWKTAISDSLFKQYQNENVHLEDLPNDASVNEA